MARHRVGKAPRGGGETPGASHSAPQTQEKRNQSWNCPLTVVASAPRGDGGRSAVAQGRDRFTVRRECAYGFFLSASRRELKRNKFRAPPPQGMTDRLFLRACL